jgi:hypothetical protein
MSLEEVVGRVEEGRVRAEEGLVKEGVMVVAGKEGEVTEVVEEMEEAREVRDWVEAGNPMQGAWVEACSNIHVSALLFPRFIA